MKSMQKIFILLFIAVGLHIHLQAQYWKMRRWDLMFGAGASNMFGDLGGGNVQNGYFLSCRDLNIRTTRYAIHAGLRYKIRKRFSVKASLYAGLLAADDQEAENWRRKARNLHFRSPILEFSTQYEYSFIKEKIGSRYAILHAGFRNLINAYFFLGVGGFYFNPATKYKGTWVKLQPLGTEGQGLGENEEKYKLFELCFPIGLGFKYTLTKKWSIGIEMGVRYTTTDYIDDVGGEYYNFEQELAAGKITREEFNPLSAILADRHFNKDGSPAKNKFKTNTGKRSGNKHINDAYMFTIIYAAKKINWSGGEIP